MDVIHRSPRSLTVRSDSVCETVVDHDLSGPGACSFNFVQFVNSDTMAPVHCLVCHRVAEYVKLL